MNREQIIEKLKDDHEYYNGIGRDYLSNSNTEMMIRTPELFIKWKNGEYTPETQTHFVIGDALHTLVLEGEEVYRKKFTVLYADVKTALTPEEKADLAVLKAKEIEIIADDSDNIKSRKITELASLSKTLSTYKEDKAEMMVIYADLLKKDKERISHAKSIINDKYSAIIKEGHVTNEPVATRNNKAYQDTDEEDRDTILLKHEEDLIYKMQAKLEAVAIHHEDVFNLIAPFNGESEVPNIINVFGANWKMKIDKETDDCIYDLKSTSDKSKFLYVAKKYNYDAQAYLYSKASGKPMKFIVIDKVTMEVAIVDCEDSFLASGQKKIEEASDNYNAIIKPALETGDLEAIKSACDYLTLI